MTFSSSSLALFSLCVICDVSASHAAPQAATPQGQAPAASPAHAHGQPSQGQASAHGHAGPVAGPAVIGPSEKHLRNLRQLTFGGENAEAYFSADGKRLSLQATTASDRCDQIYHLPVPTTAGPTPSLIPVSQGKGRHTCSYFFPDASRLIFSSTRHLGNDCPPTPDRSKGYVWPLYNYQIYTSLPDGSDVRRLTNTSSYDAEATICKDGSVIFTSDRDGDLELYRMNLDGSGVKRITNSPGYDGGAFFSEDCKSIVWRADRPKTEADAKAMKDLLSQHMVRPTRMELWVADADGKNAHQVTDLKAASFAPFFFPTSVAGAPNRRIIFSSNNGDPRGREFDLWAINSDGSQLEQITDAPDFDGFPIFSPDGKTLAFSSNRGGKSHGETNVFLADWVASEAKSTKPVAADQVSSRIRWLADPAREGRGIGTKGIQSASDELARWMQSAGLRPAGEPVAGRPSFFQSVEVVVGVRDAGSSFRVEGSGARALTPAEAVAAAMSSSGAFAGKLRFAGYGITAPESNWDDLSGVDVKGQVAVVLRGVPDGKLQSSAARSYSDLRYKAWNLREHGALAVLFVDPKNDTLPKLTLDGPEGGAGIPVGFVSRALVASLIPASSVPAPSSHNPHAPPPPKAEGPVAHLIVAAELSQSASVTTAASLSGKINLQREARKERNVVGLLPASKPNAGEVPAIVVGAHYDHLGQGGRTSMAPGVTAVHPGADDNGSGTAALFETARLLAEADRSFDVYVAAFTGEELGLVGSSRFVAALPQGLSRSRIKAMINFDMVGRLGGSPEATVPTLSVQGSDSATEWKDFILPACQQSGLSCKLGGDGYGPSDMTPFYAAGVPVLFFFTGAHADYHRPTDTADKINSLGILQISSIATQVLRSLGEKLGQGSPALTYTRPKGPAPRIGDTGGYGAYLGTIPDYTAMQGAQGGVKLSGARPGSPAEKAGVVAGDILVGLGDSRVSTLEDMTFALRKHKSGDTVDVVVRRGGDQIVKLRATLGTRPQ